MDKLISTLNEYFGKKAPQLPVNVREFIVKVSPYLAIISAVLAAPAVLALLGLSATYGAYLPYMAAANGLGISVIISIAVIVLNAMAIPGLFKRSISGWNFVFYGTIVSALGSLLTYNVLNAVISLIISFYFLFQVRSLYK